MKAEDCIGLTSHAAGQYLRELAKNVPSDRAIIEIGVYTGRSGLYLAEGSLAGNKAKVFLIDPWNMERPSKPKYRSDKTYAYAMHAIAMSPASELIIPIRQFGTVIADQWDGPKVGLLYVDADHCRQPVLDDYWSWEPHLAPGAVLVWDDFHDDFPGVAQAVNELARSGEITDPVIPAGLDRTAVAMWAK